MTGLLNLRGKDIPSSSTFFSFVILTATTLDFFTNNPTQVSANVTTALRSNVPEIALKSYEEAYAELPRIVNYNYLTLMHIYLLKNYMHFRLQQTQQGWCGSIGMQIINWSEL